MKLVTIYGSPTPPGKLATALGILEDDVRSRYPNWTVDRLAPSALSGPAALSGPSAPSSPSPTDGVAAGWQMNDVAAVQEADAVVVASPVFRGSFPGALKLLFDALPVAGLRSTPVGTLTVAAAPEHYLGAQRHLADVLSWFGALQAPNSCFFVDRVFAAPSVPEEVHHELAEFADQLVILAENVSGRYFGPEPLAARARGKTKSVSAAGSKN